MGIALRRLTRRVMAGIADIEMRAGVASGNERDSVMREPMPPPPFRDSSWFGWLIGLGLGLGGCAGLGMARQQLINARNILGSTFQFAWQPMARAQLFFVSVGVAFAVIIMMAHTGNRTRRIGLLVGGAVAPLGLLLFQWAWLSRIALPSSLTQALRWSIDNAVQSVAAVAVAALLTTLVWASVVDRRRQPSPLATTPGNE